MKCVWLRQFVLCEFWIHSKGIFFTFLFQILPLVCLECSFNFMLLFYGIPRQMILFSPLSSVGPLSFVNDSYLIPEICQPLQCRKWRGYNTGNSLLGESLEELKGWAPGQASENVTSRTPWNRSPQELPSLPVSGKWQSGGCPLKSQQESTFVAVIRGNHSSHGCCHHNCLKFEI